MKMSGKFEVALPVMTPEATLEAWKEARATFRLAYDTLLHHRLGPRPWGTDLWDVEGCAALLGDLTDDSAAQTFLEHMPANAPAVRKFCLELEHQAAMMEARTIELRLVYDHLERCREAYQLL
ncbi:hypothetical protein [Deinococcus sp. ME38]|uniref:hypothetical protein n=1 Tax=Deinococcus sp. ME38 TaxID=3400344 RepID=UPI003B5C8881